VYSQASKITNHSPYCHTLKGNEGSVFGSGKLLPDIRKLLVTAARPWSCSTESSAIWKHGKRINSPITWPSHDHTGSYSKICTV